MQVISKDGTPIAFDRIGRGPALVLVGGGFQYRSIGSSNDRFAQRLGASFTTFHYDRRGRGHSGDTQPYAVEHEIKDLDALVTEAGGSAFLFGHSSGAILALDAAQKLAGKITRLAVYEPALVVDDSRPPLPQDVVARLEEMVGSGRRDEAVAYFLTRVTGLPDGMIPDIQQSPAWPEIAAIAPTLIYDATLMYQASTASRQQLARRWGAVTIPTLVVDGEASWAWTRAAARLVAEILPNAHRRTLARQDHGPTPEALAPELEQFFTERALEKKV